MNSSGTIDSKSIMWRLASFYGPASEQYTRTIDRCEYWQSAIKGLLTVLCLTVLGCIVSALIGLVVGWIAAIIGMGRWITPQFEVKVILVSAGLMIAIGLFGFWREITADKRYQKAREKQNQEPSEFAKWWKARKEKTCIILEVK